MGDHRVQANEDGKARRIFMRHVLNDLLALEHLIADGRIENDRRRIGAEQEVFLVDSCWRPAPTALKILDRLEDPRFTTELGIFNLEANLDPCDFGGGCLRGMENQLIDLMSRLKSAAAEEETLVVLTGILPTLRKADLGLENMTPKPRYRALNDAMSALRGGAYELHIKGLDELLLRHDSVMLEACNASFQVHFQVGPEEFPNLYNIAQVVAAPVLAAGANSPLLFGRQLWHETRIALFQQSVDTRSSLDYLRERSPRVTFGDDWVHESVLELFQEDISRFRTLVTAEFETDSMTVLKEGGIPTLDALRMNNSTVYRWNRACYGITDGKPHLRIENRILPSGPSICDQVANAAFWFGLISGLSDKYDDITQLIEFKDAKLNFTAAARQGLGAQFQWLNGQTITAVQLISEHLLDLAREGLSKRGIDAQDIDRYLNIIEKRVSMGRNGAGWMTQSLSGLARRGSQSEALNALTAAIIERQKENTPVSEWELARRTESGGWKQNYYKVEQFMTTDLFTVGEDEPMDLVASLMQWKRIRHVPVEDAKHRLVGLVSYRAVLKLMAQGQVGKDGPAVSEFMIKNPMTAGPETSTLDAIEMMRSKKISCLPVVKDERLVGVITERDLVDVAAELLEEKLRGPA